MWSKTPFVKWMLMRRKPNSNQNMLVNLITSAVLPAKQVLIKIQQNT